MPTPHFDQLCRDGLKFTNAHVTNSVCVPSRTSIMTGRCLPFQKASKVGHGDLLVFSFPRQHTLGDMFHQVDTDGYVGSGISAHMTTNDGKIQGPENTLYQADQIGPTDYGFDECFLRFCDMFPYAYIRGRSGRVV